MLLCASGQAQAASSAHIIETHPASGSSLARGESFWVHIDYSTDEPISLWVRPYRDGVAIKDIMSNASLTYAGTGQALGWFALQGSGDVDEIRILAGGGRPYREWELSRHPVALAWTQAGPSSTPRPAWVDEALAIEKARYAEDAQRRASEPVSGGETALFSGFMLLILALLLAGLAVPVWCAWKWRGGWRIAALVPVIVMGFVVLRILIDTARDPTSHNLWPFEILTWGGLSLLMVGVLRLARRSTSNEIDS